MNGNKQLEGTPHLHRPNIIFVMLDDTGYGELGCYGNTFNETPNMDKLAAEGMRFTDFYTQPVCSPSRGCLMTGNNPLRNGVTNFLNSVNSCVDPNEFETLPMMLRRAGYYTGIIGKWHLNAASHYYISPAAVEKHKWHEVILSERIAVGDGDYYFPYHHIPHATGREVGKYLVDDMNEEAVAFIERNANKDQPFMLYLSHYATHTILCAPDESVEYFQKKRGTPASNTVNDRNPYMAAMLRHVDDGIGMIDDKLAELGIKENTIIVLAGDNGGETQVTVNGILRGGKRQLYEGGIRNPMIIRWPNVTAVGQTVTCPTSMIDFYQTFADVSGLDPNTIQENAGLSLLPILTGTGTLDRDTLYWCYPRNTDFKPGYILNNKTELVEGGAIRKGNYKYLQSFAFPDRRELYNLAEDPSETTNIIDQHPEIYHHLVRELHESLAADDVGKTFTATFDPPENYRWNARGNFTRDGVCTAFGDALKVLTPSDYLYYDADMTVQVKSDANGSAGIIFRSTLANPSNDAFRSYGAVINVKEQKVQLLDVIADKTIVLASADYTLSADQSYNLKVSTDSDEIKIYINDTLVLTTYDERYITGSIGLIADQSTATFKNLVVTGTQRTRPCTNKQLGF